MVDMFKGKCIGGVADSREYTHDKPEMTVQERKKLPNGDSERTGRETHYRYVLLMPHLDSNIGIWTPINMSIPEAILHLIEGYSPEPPSMNRTGIIRLN